MSVLYRGVERRRTRSARGGRKELESDKQLRRRKERQKENNTERENEERTRNPEGLLGKRRRLPEVLLKKKGKRERERERRSV